MKIPLLEFEQYIDPAIFKRGFQYFKKGHVTHVEELGGGEYEAFVEGTEDYEVRLTVQNGVMTDSVCSCPYDMGPVCKHVVAVMFHLQKEELNLTAKSKRTPKAKGEAAPKKPKTVEQHVDLILGKLSPDELTGFVREMCLRDRMFRQMFFARYEHVGAPVSKKMYADQISALVRSFKGRDGWIEYGKARQLGNAVYEMSDTARQKVARGEDWVAFHIACAVLEEMTKVLQMADDSDGGLGTCISCATDVLHSLATKPLEETLHKEMFDYLLAVYDKGIFKGWDWHFEMLSLAVEMLKTDDQASRIESKLGQIKPTGEDWDWDYRTAQKLLLELITKTKDERAVIRFMEENIANSDFRARLITKAIDRKHYDLALDMAKEGVSRDDKKHPGQADVWREFILDIYVKTKEKKKASDYARYFVVSSNGKDITSYFTLLKKYTSADEWPEILKRITVDIEKTGHWGGLNKLFAIYSFEKDWEKFLEVLRKSPSLDHISSCEKILAPHYPTELAELYKQEILKYMERNISRSHYQTACRYIRRMIKLGTRPLADELIGELRRKYPARRALMEELDLV